MGHDALTSNIKDIAELGLAAVTASLSEQKAQRNLLETFGEESQKRHDLFDAATARIEKLTSASDAQLSEITKMFREIQVQLSSTASTGAHETTSTPIPGSAKQACFQKQDLLPSLESQPLSHETIDGLSGPKNEITDERPSLDSAIDRLCRLASLKPRRVASQEAEHVIDDLETVLTMIHEQNQLLSRSESRGVKRKIDPPNGLGSDELLRSPNRALKRLRGILTASQMIDLPHSSPRRQASAKFKGKTSRNLTRKFNLEDNTVVVSYTSRVSLHSDQISKERAFNEIEDEIDYEQTAEMFEGNISVIVPKAPHATKLTVYFEQTVTSRGSSMLNPEIMFHCIRPLNSAIFHVASHGTLAEFLALLQTREASINDCDEFGRSILNVRTFLCTRGRCVGHCGYWR